MNSKNSINPINPADYAAAVDITNAIENSISFVPTQNPPQELYKKILDYIPTVTDTLEGSRGFVSSIVQTALKNSSLVLDSSTGIQSVELALNFVNFIRIPLIYFMAYMLGEKPPLTLSNNMKWLYSSVLLALPIIALAAPITAPFIAVAVAAVLFTGAVVTLGRLLWRRHQHKKAIEELTETIANEMKALSSIQDKAKFLRAELQTNPNPGKIIQEITLLKATFDEKITVLQALHDKKYEHEEKLKRKDIGRIVDKIVRTSLVAVVVIGLVVGLFFPPASVIIISAAGAVGALYTLARVMPAIIKSVKNWFGSKGEEPIAQMQNNEEPTLPLSQSLGEDKSLTKTTTTLTTHADKPSLQSTTGGSHHKTVGFFAEKTHTTNHQDPPIAPSKAVEGPKH